MRRSLALRVFLVLCMAAANSARPASLLMISIDGMKPEYVLDADAHGLKVPFLRGLVQGGTYARGVTGVWPTVTYPSHTTLLTGVWPAQHGIYNNLEFDPKHQFADGWFWYARQIRVPTLWQAAREAGLSTASVGWPVSVGATVDTLIPEYWRTFKATADLNPFDAELIAALSRPDGMLEKMQARLGPYMLGNDPNPNGDEVKTRFSLDIVRTQKPKFMTIHLSSLDEEEHGHGPFSAEANRQMEVIDGYLAQLFAAFRANDPDAISLVVSDHGFLTLTHRLNLMQAFARADLIQPGGAWKAQPWNAGGMAGIMLNQPVEPQTVVRVRELLQGLSADSNNGIAEIVERDALKARGAFPDAYFLVVMKPGFYLINDPAAPLLIEVHGIAGSHGFSPDLPEMRAAFFIGGTGIARHRDLGVIDMRRIAPTVAQLLNVSLPAATLGSLPVAP
jgi:predicted AlkP superfamily pyrophosphatase or phosphodiesterase